MTAPRTTPAKRSSPRVLDAARTGVAEPAIESTVDEYSRFFAGDRPEATSGRKGRYRDLVNHYYDLVTDFYEYGWGESFHFAPRHRGDRFADAMRAAEIYVSDRLELTSRSRAVDFGCGVGGPMRTIAGHTGARVVGINNNLYQVWKGTRANQKRGLGERCTLVKADFLATPFADGSFDGAYAFEATCHAPEARTVYAEVFRLLAPGRCFVFQEWCLTPRYDDNDPEHRELRHQIEEGNALPELRTVAEVAAALDDVGFEIVSAHDRAEECDPGRPWYLPLTSREVSLRGFQRSRPGRFLTGAMVRGLESVRIAPRGATRVSRLLNESADSLVASGEAGIFSPLHVFHARRPA